MGAVYIIVRNYPWLAIPVGIILLIESFRPDRNGKAKSGKKKAGLIFTSLFLITTSVVFIYYQGHEKAVPFVHEVFKSVLR